MHIRNQIQELSEKLIYTQFNVHAHGEALAETVNQLSSLIEIVETESKSDIKEYYKIYKQLGIYYAFHERNKESALKFFEKYHGCCAIDSEITEALNYVAYARVMDPTYHNEALFQTILSKIPDDNAEVPVLIIKAMALQYYALMLHRQEIRNKSYTQYEIALKKIEEACGIYQSLLKKFPPIKILLGESAHLWGVMLSRLGEITHSHYFLNADKLFTEAYRLEREFCLETKAPHFLTAITLQSHAVVLRYLKQPEKALEQLQTALQEQLVMFKTDVHREIAKSLHFIGDHYHAIAAYPEAVRAYLKALICKTQIKYDDDYMVNLTQNSLIKSLDSIPVNDKQLVSGLRDEIYLAFADEKTPYFNKCRDFIQNIQFKTIAITIINLLRQEGEKEEWFWEGPDETEARHMPIILENFDGQSRCKKIPLNVDIRNMKEVEVLFSVTLKNAFNKNLFTFEEYSKLSENTRSVFIKMMINKFVESNFSLLNFDVTRNHDGYSERIYYFLEVSLLKDIKRSDIEKTINDIVVKFIGYATQYRGQFMTLKRGLLDNNSFFSYLINNDVQTIIIRNLISNDIDDPHHQSIKKCL